MSISNYEKFKGSKISLEPFFVHKGIYSANDKDAIRYALFNAHVSVETDKYQSEFVLMHELWDGAKLESDRIEYLVGLALDIMLDEHRNHMRITKTQKKKFEKLSKTFPFEEIEEKGLIDKVETEKNDNVFTITKFKKDKKEK